MYTTLSCNAKTATVEKQEWNMEWSNTVCCIPVDSRQQQYNSTITLDEEAHTLTMFETICANLSNILSLLAFLL